LKLFLQLKSEKFYMKSGLFLEVLEESLGDGCLRRRNVAHVMSDSELNCPVFSLESLHRNADVIGELLFSANL
jgi:hypothetical protein